MWIELWVAIAFRLAWEVRKNDPNVGTAPHARQLNRCSCTHTIPEGPFLVQTSRAASCCGEGYFVVDCHGDLEKYCSFGQGKAAFEVACQH